MFKKILIANRGEIACRVIRTARDLGYRTVAVYSDADAQAPHVSLADEAVHIGASPAAESYLRVEAILGAARATGADRKGKLSPLAYLAAIGLSFVQPWLACALYVLVALAWLVPDRRIESRIEGS